MLELIRRLVVAPWTGSLLITSSVMANLLALATPLFVIQVLNRFLSVGEVSTLVALVSGALVAIFFEAILRASRYRLARAQSAVQDINLYTSVGSLLSEASPKTLQTQNQSLRVDWVEVLSRLQMGHGPQHICALLDVPFSLIFVLIIYLINPTLGYMAGGAAILMLLATLFVVKRDQTKQKKLAGENQTVASRLRNATVIGRRARLFTSAPNLMDQWRLLARGQIEMGRIQARRLSSQVTLSVLIQAGLTIAIISTGAILTLNGDLDVGSLIGANILAARALMPISRFATSYEAAETAKTARQTVGKLKRLPAEQNSRTALIGTVTGISARNATLRPIEGAVPYFARVDVAMQPGQLTAVFSEDDNAASAFLDMMAGLEQPDDGAALINDVNLEAVPFEWWRQQVGLIPARPEFQAASLFDNFQMVRAGTEEEVFNALQEAGVRKAVEAHPDGVNLSLTASMSSFPAEIRWRLGLARALYLGAPVLLLEDPANVVGQDLANRLVELARRWTVDGRIVVLATSSQDRARKSDQILELRRGQPALVHQVQEFTPPAHGAMFAGSHKPIDPHKKGWITRDMQRVRWASQALAVAVIGFVGAVSFWAYQAELDRVTQAAGEVVPSAQVQTIESLEGGIVSRILIAEGDTVTREQPIMELAAIADDADIGELSVRLTGLQLTAERLRAELSKAEQFEPRASLAAENPEMARQAQALFKSRQDRLRLDLATQNQVIRQREQAIVEIDTAIKTSKRQIGIVGEQVKISEGLLADELTNRMVHLDFVSALAELQAGLAQAQAGRRTAEAALEEAKSQLNVIVSASEEQAHAELEAVTLQLREFANRMGKLRDTKDRRVLRSPMDGTVKALSTFSEGAVVAPGEVVAEVVPQDDAFVIEALLPVSEVGFVTEGMPVRIRLATQDAFNFGAIEGEVLRVSPDTFTDDNNQTFYKMTVSTTKDGFPGDDRIYNLVPGLQVSCAVLLGKRTIVDYLAGPILQNLGTAFRER